MCILHYLIHFEVEIGKILLTPAGLYCRQAYLHEVEGLKVGIHPLIHKPNGLVLFLEHTHSTLFTTLFQ